LGVEERNIASISLEGKLPIVSGISNVVVRIGGMVEAIADHPITLDPVENLLV
jgi:hypothetical protein